MSALKQNLTDEERLDCIEQIFAADDRGDYAEANRLQLQIPLPVSTFQVAKAMFGKEYIQHLIDEGHDFSLIEEMYGKDFINYEFKNALAR